MIRQAGVYEIVNTVNGKRYIGSSVCLKTRWKDHRVKLRGGRHGNVKLQRAWNKHGPEAFEFHILLVCSRANTIMYEQRCLDTLAPEYNIAKDAVAPMLGMKFSDAHKAKIGAASRSRVRSPETLARMSQAQLGKKRAPFTPEHRANMGKANLGKQKFLGRKHTEETRARMSAAQTGKVFTAEHLANMSKAQTGRKSPAVAESNRRRAIAARAAKLISTQENQP